MEKIDLTKCNNLRYKAKIDGNEDYGRICIENAATGLAFLCSDREGGYVAVWHCDVPEIEGWNSRKVTDFEIVPRDPETYQDWQVRDVLHREDADTMAVIFRSGELVVLKSEYGIASSNFTCIECFSMGYRLVLTDIEQQIIEGEKKYEPQDGDVVYAKVRHNDNDAVFIYKKTVENRIYGYAGYNIGFDKMVDTSGFAYITPDIIGDLIEYRQATDEEKQRLFDAMAKEGKRWNAEKKVVEDIPKPYEFKKGEPVLVRDYDDNIWKLAAFRQRSGNASYPYEICNERGNYYNHRLCIPYNERTMHLLGTTEDYKEK